MLLILETSLPQSPYLNITIAVTIIDLITKFLIFHEALFQQGIFEGTYCSK